MRIAWWVWLIGAVVVGGAVLAPFASPLPDGLESVIDREGITVKSRPQPAPLPDYQTPGVGNERLGGVVAAAIGIAVTALAALGLSALLSRAGRRGEKAGKHDPASSSTPDSASFAPKESQ